MLVTNYYGAVLSSNALLIIFAYLPQLEMVRSNNIAFFQWSTGYPGFVLETTTNLLPATWVAVPYSPIQVGDQYVLPLDMTGTNGFYRLRFLGP